MAPGHVLTHAGPIYRYSINLSFCLREPLCCSAICVLPDRSVNWTPPPACIAPGWGFSNSAALPIMKDSAGLCSARPTRAGIWNSPTVATIPSLPRQEMKICWCCITHSRRNGKHSAPPWTPPGFCGSRRLTLTGRSMASLSSTATAIAPCCKTAPGEKYEALPISRRIKTVPYMPCAASGAGAMALPPAATASP